MVANRKQKKKDTVSQTSGLKCGRGRTSVVSVGSDLVSGDEQINVLGLYKSLWRINYYKLAEDMLNIPERTLAPLDLSGSAPQVVRERWKQWERSYQYYIDRKRITGITNASRTKSQLLHLAGF